MYFPACAAKACPAASGSALSAKHFLSQPMASEIYTADPSGHVFGSKLWIYAGLHTDRPLPEDDLGAHVETRSLHVPRIDKPGGPVTICPVAFDVKQLP